MFVTYDENIAHVQLPHTKYVDKVLRSNSFEELWSRFKDAESPSKEISESYAAFSNLKKICNISANTWIHIGDGGHTRTAAIFAFFSKSLNLSIDPAINEEKYSNWYNKFKPKGIMACPQRYEYVPEHSIEKVIDHKSVEDEYLYSTIYSICLVHAHVKIEEVDKQYPHWTYLYTNPCCKPETQMFTEDYMKKHGIVKRVDRIDLGILSDKRRVIIYKKL